MGNEEATILYIIVMLVGSIFIDRWIIWFWATVIYARYLNRFKK